VPVSKGCGEYYVFHSYNRLPDKRYSRFLLQTEEERPRSTHPGGPLAARGREVMIDTQVIRQTEAEMDRLHSACRAAASRQRGSVALRQEYLRAAEEFRTFQSPLWELWSAHAQRAIVTGNGGWRDTAILYLQISPRFFRSGYLRNVVCTNLKQAALMEQERTDIQEALLRSIVRRPSTGSFRYDCRLAIKVANKPFLRELRVLCITRDPWIGGRALCMEKTILRHTSFSSDADI
jgi:hypothetical protein